MCKLHKRKYCQMTHHHTSLEGWEEEFDANKQMAWIKELVPNSSYAEIKSFIRSLLTQREAEWREQLSKLKRGLGSGDGYLLDRGYNEAIDDVLNVLSSLTSQG